jgi:hypothetical protein
MQTVNFHCGHCGNLMAVGTENLGQQVRCPHCQQIVLAPAVTPSEPAPPPSPPPPDSSDDTMFAVPPPQEPESIFTPAEEHTDDLFGEAPAPKVEMPPGGSWHSATPASAPPSAFNNLTRAAPPAPGAATSATEMFTEKPPASFGGSSSDKTLDVTAPRSDWTAPPSAELLAPPTREQAAALRPTAPLGYQSPVRNFSTAIIIIPLISYCILATIAVIILYFRSVTDPLEALPDDGDNRGAKHKQTSLLDEKRIAPTNKLPDKLKVALGDTITVGDLEITPQKIERRSVIFRRPRGQPDKGGDDTLVLQLHLRNVSNDLVFCPTDPYFDRRYRAKQGGNRPYMYVDVGGHQFFGGALDWSPPDKKDAPRETIDGQHYGQALGPGETMTTIVCTDPEARVASAVENAKGTAVWRVQLRRGLVLVRGREIPATAVIGVVFHKEDIRRG